MLRRLLSSSRRSLLTGVGVSSALHLLVLASLAIDAVWPFLQMSIALHGKPNFAIALEARVLEQTAETPAIAIDATPNGPVDPAAHPDPSAATGDPFAARVADRVQAAAQRADERSDDENLKQLEKLSGQLERLSSEQAVGEMAGKLGQWLGTSRRATQPAAAQVAGEFDFATAQLHDVRRRRRDAQDQWAYWAVLVDGAGRLRESAMLPEEGASAYKTMQLIKSSPLAEMVYRQIAMSLLDEIIKTAQQAEQAASRAASQEAAPVTTAESPASKSP